MEGIIPSLNSDQERTCLLSLPNETLTHISAYLGLGRDATLLMRTCHRLMEVGEYLRYGSLVVAGDLGKNLMVTLSLGTPTSRQCCQRVQRLWYKGWDTTDSEDRTLASYLFTSTLPLLSNLHTLIIESPAFDTEYLRRRMEATGLMRLDQHQSFGILDDSNRANRSSVMALIALQHLRITAPVHILSIVTHRPISTLDITIILDKTTFGKFISSSEGSNIGQTLTTLSIKLAGVLHIALAFPMVAAAFPALLYLSIDQTDLDARVRYI